MYRLLLLIILATSANAEALPPIDWPADLEERNARAKAQSHCVSDEVAVFTCMVGKKVVSICASKVLNESQGYLQYRFGARNSIELEVPPKENYKPAMVAYKNGQCASCYANYVRFQKGDYSYYVFNASVRGPNDPKTGASTRDEPSGIVVKRNDKVIYSRRCTTPAFDHNVGEHLWGKAVVTLGAEDDADPFDIAFPAKP
jgi:hypothetical protein